MTARLTFVYIVEPPEYQIFACTLLASIRAQFGEDVAAVGYCPEHRMDELHPAVFRAHEMMGAEIRPMRTLGMWDTDYPHGNKIIAAMQPRDSDYSAFVDSDVLFLRPNSAGNLLRAGHVSCSVAASMTWAGPEIWAPIWGAFDLSVPEQRVEYMRRPVGPVPPYYSSGLVVFPETGPQRFADVWYDTARTIDRIDGLENRRPYLDQMSLPVAIARAGLDWHELPEEQHFIMGGRLRGEPLPADRDVFTVHYRNNGVLKESGLLGTARALLEEKTGVPYVRRLTEGNLRKKKEGFGVMGISLIPGLFLARNARHAAGTGSAVILGRQKMHMPRKRMARFVARLNDIGFAVDDTAITQPDGFSETLLTALGYPPVEALDFTDAEGAQHIHDLNLPLPEQMHERFDVVIDGGTTEHVFHIGQALENCHAMLKPGGLMLSYVACDGWFGHGFFQTGPDVPWRYWHHARGCEMIEVSVVGRRTPRHIVPIPDPTALPRGGERSFEGPQMILYACRKPHQAPPYAPPIQGHYV